MKRGFTLLEILIVIIIIAILATFAIPQYIRAAKRAIASEAISVIGSIKGALARYYQEYGTLPPREFSSEEGSWPLDIDNPKSVAGANFSYTIAPKKDATGPSAYEIIAASKTPRSSGITVYYDGSQNKYEVCYNNQHLAGSEDLNKCGGGGGL